MERREFLSSIAVGGSLILGGCNMPNLGNGTSDTDVLETTSDRRVTSTATMAFEIGERIEDVNPHSVFIVNKGEETQTIDLSISLPVQNETLLESTYSIPPDKEVRGELRNPAYYNLRISLPETGAHHEKAVEGFDYCNSYRTTVEIQSEENITSTIARTMVGCDSPEFPTPNTTETE